MSEELPPDLGSRGSRLWREMTASGSLTPAHLVLLEEACRLADRLDWLNTILQRACSPVKANDGDDEGESPAVGPLLAEARQQQTALRGLVAEIRQAQKGSVPASGKPASKAGGSGVADLSARIAARRGQAPG
ncbi:hypothetical protein GCM10009574_028270 [Streptomyces asiaticus]